MIVDARIIAIAHFPPGNHGRKLCFYRWSGFAGRPPRELGTTWALTEPKWVEKRRVTGAGASFCVF